MFNFSWNCHFEYINTLIYTLVCRDMIRYETDWTEVVELDWNYTHPLTCTITREFASNRKTEAEQENEQNFNGKC